MFHNKCFQMYLHYNQKKILMVYRRYQELKSMDGAEKFDSKYNLLTLSINIDGVETAKSASNSLYPLQVIFRAI